MRHARLGSQNAIAIAVAFAAAAADHHASSFRAQRRPPKNKKESQEEQEKELHKGSKWSHELQLELCTFRVKRRVKDEVRN